MHWTIYTLCRMMVVCCCLCLLLLLTSVYISPSLTWRDLVTADWDDMLMLEAGISGGEVVPGNSSHHGISGGEVAPGNSSHHAALIVPYRNREEQLHMFLAHIHPFLRRQSRLHYRLYLINQGDQQPFNRGKLMNIGFVEAMKDFNWTCVVFHDVDLLPEDDRNLYTCPYQPRHMSVLVDKWGYKLPYPTIFGGVTAIRKEHFRKVNGYSNSFWGWGGEDDDMYNRVKYHGLTVTRYGGNISRYKMISHKEEEKNKDRLDLLHTGPIRFATDGLNNLTYKLISRDLEQNFTKVNVSLLS